MYQEEGVAFVRSQNVHNGLFHDEGLAYIGEEAAHKLRGVTVKPADVLLNITGDSVARCCLIPETRLPARVSQHVAIIRPRAEQLRPRFLMYYLTSPFMQAKLLSIAGSGGTRKAITKAQIEKLKVPLPSPEVQDTILDELSAYDDLIENNRKRIKLLERAARLLYKEWFVRLRFPGCEGVKLVKTELGNIPATWKVTPLGELCTKIGSGSTPRGGEAAYKEEGVILVRSQNVYDFAFTMDGLAYIDDEQAADLDGVTLQANDILLNITGASVGRCCMMPSRLLPGRVNQHVMIIRADAEKISPAYVLCVLNSPARKAQLLSLAQGKGATREALTKSSMEQFKIVLPEEGVWKAFAEKVEPMFDLRETLESQNAALTHARDLLLPRLMSGKVKV